LGLGEFFGEVFELGCPFSCEISVVVRKMPEILPGISFVVLIIALLVVVVVAIP
jgi:hypothetical protein